MCIPKIKRKKCHFISIELFSKCVLKYFSQIVHRILSDEDDGGMKDVMDKF